MRRLPPLGARSRLGRSPTDSLFRSQIEIVNHPKARKLDHSLYATIAGAAPTATLIEELEKLGITVVHGELALLSLSDLRHVLSMLFAHHSVRHL